jgi:hypothetical protein
MVTVSRVSPSIWATKAAQNTLLKSQAGLAAAKSIHSMQEKLDDLNRSSYRWKILGSWPYEVTSDDHCMKGFGGSRAKLERLRLSWSGWPEWGIVRERYPRFTTPI